MTQFWQDIKYGARTLIGSPLFTAVAVVSLGLGIGAVTSVYSMLSSVIIHTLPFEDPERLVSVEDIHFARDGRWSVSYPLFLDWQEQNGVCEYLSVFSGGSFNLSGPEGPEWVRCGFITSSFFPMLRVQPFLGRNFLPAEDAVGEAKVVMLSHRLWMDRFRGREDVIGEGITLDAESFTVVGVVDPGFRFLETNDAQVWVPAAGKPWSKSRGSGWLNAMARLKEGVSYEQAAAAMTAITQGLAEIYPEHYTERGVRIRPASEESVEDLRLAFIILLGCVAFVLLISCVNVANLLLARMAGRQREVAIRIALGASRGRLLRQLLTESLVLALMGGALGILFSKWGNSFIIALLPDRDAQFYIEYFQFGMNAEVLSVALAVTVSTALFFGLVPALQASRPDLNQTLKEGGVSAGLGGRRRRLLSALVVSEVALAVVLLISAGLMMRSFQNLRRVDPGFEPANLLTFGVNLPEKTYPALDQRSAFFDRLEERIAALNTVESVGCTSVLPFSNSNSTNAIAIEGLPDPGLGNYFHAGIRMSTPGYPETMGIPLLKGRPFTEGDHNPDAQVALVNEAMAKQFWPGEDPIGKRFKRGTQESDVPWTSVVGLLGDVRHGGFDSPPEAEFYLPYAQSGWSSLNVLIRTTGDPAALTSSVRQIVRELDPDQPLMEVQTMELVIETSVWMNRFNAILFAALGGVALLLAAVGVYGVISYSVSQRTHEIGIRMALGAQTADVRRLVVWQAFKLILSGVLIGLLGAFGLTRLLQGLLYGVSANDPVTFAGIAGLLMAVSLTASYIPARRATRVPPVTALRYE